MTREEDAGLYDEEEQGSRQAQDLQRRCQRIKEADPVCAVSIHQNSYQDETVKGAQVFYYQNSAEGKKLAERIQTALRNRADPENKREARGNASYYMLKNTAVPLVIVECGFLSNPEEAARLSEESYQERLAEAVAEGILGYLEDGRTADIKLARRGKGCYTGNEINQWYGKRRKEWQKAKIVKMTEDQLDQEALKEAGILLQNGGLVAFPTETVYGLGGNALDPEASRKIYAAKGRPSDNPLIVHIADMEHLPPIVRKIPEAAARLAAAYWPGPLTMIFWKSSRVPYETTGGLDSVAVRMPESRIARELIRRAGGYVAAPSANTSGRPSPTLASHVEEDLGDKIDMILDGGRVKIGLESTIVDFTEDVPVILRPGYLNRQMLDKVTWDGKSGSGATERKYKGTSQSAGHALITGHYAPRAELTIVEGPEDRVAEQIRRLVREKTAGGTPGRDLMQRRDGNPVSGRQSVRPGQPFRGGGDRQASVRSPAAVR